MAQLSSPGVSVEVIDESFYTTAAPGTVPLIFVASAENKQNAAGTGTAPGTLKANAGKVYLITSQKELVDTFGTPKFITDVNNNPVHAGEQNEYGLQAAYSYLGVSSRAYVVRADVDMTQLDQQVTPPTGLPIDGSYWFNTKDTKFGVFEWNAASIEVTGGQTFTVKYPTVITNMSDTELVGSVNAPKATYGAIGSYAIVAVSTTVRLWYKKPLTFTAAGTWVEVGSPEWIQSIPVVVGSISSPVTVGKTLTINGTNIQGADLANVVSNIKANVNLSTVEAAVINGKLALYSLDGIAITLGGTMLTSVISADAVSRAYNAAELTISTHTQPPAYKSSANDNPTGSVWIKTTTPNLGASWSISRYNSATLAWANLNAPLFKDNLAALAALDSTAGGLNLAGNTLYVKYNETEETPVRANFKIYRRIGVGPTIVKSGVILNTSFDVDTDYSFSVQLSNIGSAEWSAAYDVAFTGTGVAATDADNIAIELSKISENLMVTITSTNQLTIQHVNGGEIKFIDDLNTPVAILFGAIDLNTGLTSAGTANMYGDSDGNYIASLWSSLSDDRTQGFTTASATAATSITPNGQLWYNRTTDEVDIMINDGTTWVGYRNYDLGGGIGATDVSGPIVSASMPTTQADGSRLAEGDLWIDTSDSLNYPIIYKYHNFPKKWILVDNTDQTTDAGIIFHDARWNTTGKTAEPATIAELLTSDFLDTDAPDPALYPKGMLLWNLRRSGNNVKRFVQNYFDLTARNIRYENEFMGSSGTYGTNNYVEPYYAHAWVSEAANQIDGAGTFGSKSQRAVVVQALQALVNKNQEIRDEEARLFNLIACPGYPELVGEMKNLNYDRGITAFVVADTPARLTPDATSLGNWGNNLAGAAEDNDKGLVTSDEYLAFFYPWGYSSDNLGNNIAVPPSHMMLRTIALSDMTTHPWFAPAGTRRGGITNASNVGYITSEGEFQTVALNTGQRDTLASVKVNPITFINGAGIVNYGQYTRAKNASSLDRINVARLVIQLRTQFAKLAKPYLFEPNDKNTRAQIKHDAEALLLELQGQRAVYDFIVVCDESNNTAARIDRNELYLDVAIEPVKSVEFIYIPLVLRNTGELKGLGA